MRRSIHKCASLFQKAQQKLKFNSQAFNSKAVRNFAQNSQQHNFKSGAVQASAPFGKYFTYAGAVFLISLAGYMYKNSNQEQEFVNSAVFADEKKSIPPYLNSTVFKDDEHPVYRIVLTGGPCAGKSSAMSQLSERLKALGFQVFIVQEIATMMMTGGCQFRPDMSLSELLQFETSLIKIQLAVEDSYADLAKASKKPTILLCDRGVMDPKAYLDAEKFSMLLDMNNWNVGKLRDSRYDCIIHLVTAAYGAEKYYTLANNAARSESIDQARQVDNRLREAYIGHPNLHIVDNSTNFEGKLQRVVNVVSHVIGIPKPINSKRKYLVASPVNNLAIDIPFEETDIEQSFLDVESEKEQRRLRRAKSKDGVITYTLSSRVVSADGKDASVVFRPISGKAHFDLLSQQDRKTKPVRKFVRSFIYKHHYFELATYLLNSTSYLDPKNPTVVCVEALPGQEIEFPPFLKDFVTEDVTTKQDFSSYGYSKRE